MESVADVELHGWTSYPATIRACNAVHVMSGKTACVRESCLESVWGFFLVCDGNSLKKSVLRICFSHLRHLTLWEKPSTGEGTSGNLRLSSLSQLGLINVSHFIAFRLCTLKKRRLQYPEIVDWKRRCHEIVCLCVVLYCVSIILGLLQTLCKLLVRL